MAWSGLGSEGASIEACPRVWDARGVSRARRRHALECVVWEKGGRAAHLVAGLKGADARGGMGGSALPLCCGGGGARRAGRGVCGAGAGSWAPGVPL